MERARTKSKISSLNFTVFATDSRVGLLQIQPDDLTEAVPTDPDSDQLSSAPSPLRMSLSRCMVRRCITRVLSKPEIHPSLPSPPRSTDRVLKKEYER
jgi:hypothetical protein